MSANDTKIRIVVLLPISEALDKFLTNAAKLDERFDVQKSEDPGEVTQLIQQLNPCILVTSITNHDMLTILLTTLAELKPIAKSGKIKALITNKLKSAQVAPLLEQNHIQGVVQEPVNERTLKFKLNLLVKSLETTDKKDKEEQKKFKMNKDEKDAQAEFTQKVVNLEVQEEKIDGDTVVRDNIIITKKGGLNDLQDSVEELPELTLNEDFFVFKARSKVKGTEKEKLELEGPDPETGKWHEHGLNKESGKPRWLFVPKVEEGDPEPDLQTGWVFEGDKPKWNVKNKSWEMEGEEPELSYWNKKEKIATKVSSKKNKKLQLAKNSEKAKEFVKNNLEKFKEKKERIAKEKVEKIREKSETAAALAEKEALEQQKESERRELIQKEIEKKEQIKKEELKRSLEENKLATLQLKKEKELEKSLAKELERDEKEKAELDRVKEFEKRLTGLEKRKKDEAQEGPNKSEGTTPEEKNEQEKIEKEKLNQKKFEKNREKSAGPGSVDEVDSGDERSEDGAINKLKKIKEKNIINEKLDSDSGNNIDGKSASSKAVVATESEEEFDANREKINELKKNSAKDKTIWAGGIEDKISNKKKLETSEDPAEDKKKSDAQKEEEKNKNEKEAHEEQSEEEKNTRAESETLQEAESEKKEHKNLITEEKNTKSGFEDKSIQALESDNVLSSQIFGSEAPEANRNFSDAELEGNESTKKDKKSQQALLEEDKKTVNYDLNYFYRTLAELGLADALWQKAGEYYVYIAATTKYRGFEKLEDLLPIWIVQCKSSPEFLEKEKKWRFLGADTVFVENLNDIPYDVQDFLLSLKSKKQNGASEELSGEQETDPSKVALELDLERKEKISKNSGKQNIFDSSEKNNEALAEEDLFDQSTEKSDLTQEASVKTAQGEMLQGEFSEGNLEGKNVLEFRKKESDQKKFLEEARGAKKDLMGEPSDDSKSSKEESDSRTHKKSEQENSNTENLLTEESSSLAKKLMQKNLSAELQKELIDFLKESENKKEHSSDDVASSEKNGKKEKFPPELKEENENIDENRKLNKNSIKNAEGLLSGKNSKKLQNEENLDSGEPKEADGDLEKAKNEASDQNTDSTLKKKKNTTNLEEATQKTLKDFIQEEVAQKNGQEDQANLQNIADKNSGNDSSKTVEDQSADKLSSVFLDPKKAEFAIKYILADAYFDSKNLEHYAEEIIKLTKNILGNCTISLIEKDGEKNEYFLLASTDVGLTPKSKFNFVEDNIVAKFICKKGSFLSFGGVEFGCFVVSGDNFEITNKQTACMKIISEHLSDFWQKYKEWISAQGRAA